MVNPKGIAKTVRRRIDSIADVFLPYVPSSLCYLGWPQAPIIEMTNACNLKCPLCPTAMHMEREIGYMKEDDFKKVIDDLKGRTDKVLLSFAGEPLLNKDIFKMVKYAEDSKIGITISTNTVILDRYIADVFDSGLTELLVCLDGATKETQESYRVGSDFDQVVANIKAVCAEKEKRGAVKPRITLQFIVMKQNEHEIERIKELAHEMGVDYLRIKNVGLGSGFSEEETQKMAEKYVPDNKRYTRYSKDGDSIRIKESYKVCPWVRQTVIMWNGDVSICCFDFNGEYIMGNMFSDGGLGKVLKSKRYKSHRKRIINRDLEICKDCNFGKGHGESFEIRGQDAGKA